MFTGKIAVIVRHLLGSLFQPHKAHLLHYGFDFLPGSVIVYLGVDCLEYLCRQLHLRARCYGEHIAVKVDGTVL